MKAKTQLNGRHSETGSVHNALALQGLSAPHTGKPYSEALLLGVSGGIAFGYFTFEYKGYLPHVAILTRNTFSPFQAVLERLGIAQDVQQTNKAETAEGNLMNTLESGLYPILWADQFSLPYNFLSAAYVGNDAHRCSRVGWQNRRRRGPVESAPSRLYERAD